MTPGVHFKGKKTEHKTGSTLTGLVQATIAVFAQFVVCYTRETAGPHVFCGSSPEATLYGRRLGVLLATSRVVNGAG